MTNSKLLTIFLILFSYSCNGQTRQEMIVGDWVEVRRETRLGYVYNRGGALNEPSIQMSFASDGFGTFYNPETPDPKTKTDYKFIGDSIFVFVRINEIVQLDNTNLLLILRTSNRDKSDHDLKCTFIRKSAYDKLSKKEIENLKAPTQKDINYKDSCKQAGQNILNSDKAPDFYQFVEVMPTFPGGDDAMKLFIHKNLNYPQTGADCEGIVYLSFIIEITGELSNIKIERSLCSDFDKEAIRVVEHMPKWTVGQQNGKTVRVKMNIPVSFKLE